VFVYEAGVATVLRSRTVASASSVLAVAPDGIAVHGRLTLFETSHCR